MFFITKTEQTHHKPLRYQASKIDLLVAYVVRIGCALHFSAAGFCENEVDAVVSEAGEEEVKV